MKKRAISSIFQNRSILFLFFLISYSFAHGQSVKVQPQRVIILMLDGFGEAYYRNSSMPNLNELENKGIFKVVPSLMPSVTNLNNASIATGLLPNIHGITGNSFVDPVTGLEEFMEASNLLLAPTIFQRAKQQGVESVLFSSKKKSIGLLYKGTTDTLSPETASDAWKTKLGSPPSIYSCEVNFWLMEAALYSIQKDTSIRLFYIHTTDYPMHTWAPENDTMKTYLHQLDKYIGKIKQVAPDAAILITADHTVNHKDACWDLNKACKNRNIPIRMAISPERDKYFKHHRGFGGTAYVYLQNQQDLWQVKQSLKKLPGIEEVLTKKEAAKRFNLMPSRIGDLIVLGDNKTVFGDLQSEEYEKLPANYRTHGSLYEARVPIFIYNAHNAPPAYYFNFNYQVAAWLYSSSNN